jgi:hypothetical protein
MAILVPRWPKFLISGPKICMRNPFIVWVVFEKPLVAPAPHGATL